MDETCLEIIAELMRRLQIARDGALAVVLQAFASKALPDNEKQRILETGGLAIGESELDIV